MWRAAKPYAGFVDQLYPTRVPARFSASPRDIVVLLGEPNSFGDPSKTSLGWDVTDGESWVHVYNNKRAPHVFSVRGNAPRSASSFLNFVKSKKIRSFQSRNF